MFVLKLFGGLSLENSAGEVPTGALQRRRLALLALLAAVGPRGMTREQVQVLLWPENQDDRARHALDQLLYLVRQDLGRDAVLADGVALRLNPNVLASDLTEFDDAVARGDLARAARSYAGRLLDGVRLGNAPGLERWVDEQREARAQRYAGVLERLATAAERDGAHVGAAEWWRRRAALDPYSVAATLGLMRALAAAGDPARAVCQARIYEALVRNELALEPDPAVATLARALATRPQCPRDDEAVGPPHGVPAANTIPARAPESRLATMPVLAAAASRPIDRPTDPRHKVALAPASDPARPMAAKSRWRSALVGPGVRVLLPVAAVAMLALSRSNVWARLRGESETARATVASPAASSVAVLPLADLSADRESDFFGDGLTEELIQALSRIPALQVAARTSVFALKGRPGDVRQIGRMLGVRSVLEGSIRRDGGRVRVNVRLVDATTGYERWAESYDRRLVDVLAVQREIAAAVTDRLSSGTTGLGGAAQPAAPTALNADTHSYAAFEHYLRGRFYLNQGGALALARAADELRAAIAADSRYARAHAALAEAYTGMAEASGGQREQAALLVRAEGSARRAIDLEPRLAEAHASLGNFLLNRWDWRGAAGEFRRAIAENPSFAAAHERYGILLALRGDFDRSIAVMRRAQELDPLSLGIQGSTAYVFNMARQYRAAEAVARRLVAIDPARESPHFRLGSVLLQQGRYDEAARELETATRLPPATQNRALPLLGYTYARAGRTADAVRLRPLVERGLADHTISPYFAAAYFGAMGQADRAFNVLDDLGSRRESCLRDLAVDPVMDPLHLDPRFADVLRTVGLDGIASVDPH